MYKHQHLKQDIMWGESYSIGSGSRSVPLKIVKAIRVLDKLGCHELSNMIMLNYTKH